MRYISSQGCLRGSCLSLTSSKVPVSGAAAAESHLCTFCGKYCKEHPVSGTAVTKFF